MGKRQIGELEPIELVVAVLISNLASQPLADTGIPLIYGLVPVLTLFCCQVLISYLTLKSIKFRHIICGKPSVLIDNGKIMQAELKKSRISIDELYASLRSKQVTDISTIKHAILETDGSLSVLLYTGDSPATPKQLNITVQENGAPVAVISDGRILSDNLKKMGLNMSWINKQLEAQNAKRISDVYIMTVDGQNNINLVLKEEQH
jgi:uncharacterized membrane protein YcaP (DUF421 family)